MYVSLRTRAVILFRKGVLKAAGMKNTDIPEPLVLWQEGHPVLGDSVLSE